MARDHWRWNGVFSPVLSRGIITSLFGSLFSHFKGGVEENLELDKNPVIAGAYQPGSHLGQTALAWFFLAPTKGILTAL